MRNDKSTAYEHAECSIFQQLNLSVVASLNHEKRREESDMASVQLKRRLKLPPPKQFRKMDFDQTFQGTFPSINIETYDSMSSAAQPTRPKLESALDSSNLFSEETTRSLVSPTEV